jgi:hypothetical protein
LVLLFKNIGITLQLCYALVNIKWYIAMSGKLKFTLIHKGEGKIKIGVKNSGDKPLNLASESYAKNGELLFSGLLEVKKEATNTPVKFIGRSHNKLIKYETINPEESKESEEVDLKQFYDLESDAKYSACIPNAQCIIDTCDAPNLACVEFDF